MKHHFFSILNSFLPILTSAVLFASVASSCGEQGQPGSENKVKTAASVDENEGKTAENEGKSVEFTQENFGGYLLVYFREHNHDLYYALSSDGYTFTDVNAGKCAYKGIDMAEQKGIRDPHVFRGPDGLFYLTMTDLHIYAKQEGLRDTEWQRDGGKYGWGNNKSIILMKSKDLINWDRTIYNVVDAFPQLGDIRCVWAPQTQYDPEKKQLFVYFTMGVAGGENQLYYSFMDKDFTKFATVPQKIGFNPPMNQTYIDGDICKVGDTYHLFTSDNGIKHAESKQMLDGYKYVTNENVAKAKGGVEAPTVWRRFGTDTYVLMYDNYSQPNEMAFAETTDFREFKDLGRFNQGIMKTTNFDGAKHGAVIWLTKDEAAKIAAHWKLEKF